MDAFKAKFLKFALDVFEGAVAGAGAVLLTTPDATPAKTLAIAVLIGALNGAISAARRYVVSTFTPA